MQLAVAQAPVELGDVDANLATSRKLLKQAQSACDGGLDLLVLPELFLTGYLLRDDYARVAEAVPGDGPAQAGLAALAAESSVHIAAGLVERGRESLYNVALLVGPDGYIGHYRKRYLPNFGPFEEKLYFGAGDATPVFETPLGRIGMQVCYDIFFPTQSLALAHAGAELILNISASPTTSRPLFHRMLPARAIETTCFWAFANNVGVQGSLTFGGESCIVDPRGSFVGEAPALEPGGAVAEIDLGALPAFREARPVLRDSQ